MSKRVSLRVCALVLITIFVSFSAWAEYSLDAVDGDPIEAVYVDDFGNVGICSAEPSANLTVKGNPSKPLTGFVEVPPGTYMVEGVGTLFTQELKVGDSILIGLEVFTVDEILSDTELILDSLHSTGERDVKAYTDNNLFLVTNRNDEEKFVVDSSGNVGIGTATPSKSLEVVGTVKASAFEGDGSALTGITDAQIPDNITVNYAATAGNADTVDGKDASSFTTPSTDAGRYNVVSTLYEGTKSLSSRYIDEGQSNSINSNMIQSGAVTSSHISDGSIQKHDMNNNAKCSLDASDGYPDDQVYVSSNGNVGIGTTSPSQELHVYKYGDNADVRVESSKSSVIDFGTGSRGHFVFGYGKHDLYFGTNGKEKMRLTSAGNVGIGTTGPGAKLHIHSVAAETPDDDVMFRVGSGGKFAIDTHGVVGGRVTVLENGNVGIGTTRPSYKLQVNGTAFATGAAGSLSDYRQKRNINDISFNALDLIKDLHPVTFEWKEPQDNGMEGTQLGFVAQEVEKVLPEAVITQDNEEQTKGLKYNAFIPLLTKAVQELDAENEALKAEDEALKAENNSLRQEIEQIKEAIGL